ncbi:MAG TPA: TetR/AcrR family transcriptional regulator [Candidatus Binataceae bacterium]|jgi:TetR/AcrR family fatty acid metabolism transcriptional regulator|nr:TetR/AcrR family transcriptional regulator [Candidatus Binataceae bacterium]
MASESRSPAQEKPQDSRDEILQAAIRLFARRGFHETSMSEVAREAQVSKALIFWHFKTKEELFLAVLNRLLEPYFIDFAEEVGALDERSQLRRLVQSYLLFVRDNAASVRFFLGQLLHGEKVPEELSMQVMKLYEGYRELMVDIIRRAQEKGLCARDIAPEAAARFMLSALNGSLIGFLFSPGSSAEIDGTVAMIGNWLFGEAQTRPAEGGKAVA